MLASPQAPSKSISQRRRVATRNICHDVSRNFDSKESLMESFVLRGLGREEETRSGASHSGLGAS